jgi:DNA (cytosine-5)-methyltransferase 1
MVHGAGVIDLFAGPGGLGEGFSAFETPDGSKPFHIALSAEKESSAHRTLQLRAFFRQFGDDVPKEYFDYIKGDMARDELVSRHHGQWDAAVAETLGGPRALGEKGDDELIESRLKELKQASDAPWVLIGGPPCQAYSLVGRARNRGIEGYSPEKDRRHFLYEEYLKMLTVLEPAVFVMENVKGLLSSSVAGERIFERICEDLANPGGGCFGPTVAKRKTRKYRIYSLVPESRDAFRTGDLSENPHVDCLIRSEQFGVPQARHRVILMGVREDLPGRPAPLVPAGDIVCARHVLQDLDKIRSGLSREPDSLANWHAAVAKAAGRIKRAAGDRGNELEKIVESAGRLKSRGRPFAPYSRKFARGSALGALGGWLRDDRLGGFVNHESRGHMREDLARYLFCAAYTKLHHGDSPRSHQFPDFLAPQHSNWHSGIFADRFKVQAATKPSSTITSHISKDGHYFIHYDPAQCRSLTVREAARLQTFPDNYFFEGNRTQQYVQVGNAVPPYLARQIAEVVYRILT